MSVSISTQGQCGVNEKNSVLCYYKIVMKKFLAFVALFAISFFFGSSKKSDQTVVKQTNQPFGTSVAHADAPPPPPPDGGDGSDDG